MNRKEAALGVGLGLLSLGAASGEAAQPPMTAVVGPELSIPAGETPFGEQLPSNGILLVDFRRLETTSDTNHPAPTPEQPAISPVKDAVLPASGDIALLPRLPQAHVLPQKELGLGTFSPAYTESRYLTQPPRINTNRGMLTT